MTECTHTQRYDRIREPKKNREEFLFHVTENCRRQYTLVFDLFIVIVVDDDDVDVFVMHKYSLWKVKKIAYRRFRCHDELLFWLSTRKKYVYLLRNTEQ